MVISTIKYDEHSNPTRAKYRIVVLGNLDNNEWDKCNTYTPIVNQIETCILTALAVQLKRILKSGDVKKTFCQATLPPDESYLLRLPT